MPNPLLIRRLFVPPPAGDVGPVPPSGALLFHETWGPDGTTPPGWDQLGSEWIIYSVDIDGAIDTLTDSSGYYNASGTYQNVATNNDGTTNFIEYNGVDASNSGPNISTFGKTNIRVLFGQVRLIGNTSTVELEWSISFGVWTTAPFTQAPADGLWKLITVSLPIEAENSTDLKLRFKYTGDSTGSLNSIDDVMVFGDPA